MVSCRLAHSFKIMFIPQTVIPLRVPPQLVQALHYGLDGKIYVPYIHCLYGQVPEAYEFLPLAEDGVRDGDYLTISEKILFTLTSSMHNDSRFLSWVADP